MRFLSISSQSLISLQLPVSLPSSSSSSIFLSQFSPHSFNLLLFLSCTNAPLSLFCDPPLQYFYPCFLLHAPCAGPHSFPTLEIKSAVYSIFQQFVLELNIIPWHNYHKYVDAISHHNHCLIVVIFLVLEDLDHISLVRRIFVRSKVFFLWLCLH